MARFVWTLAALAATAGCSDQEFRADNEALAGGPEIEVDPPLIDFGQLGRGDVATEAFTIYSVGTGDLNITDIRLGQDRGNYSILAEATNFFLPPGASTEIQVSFTPIDDQEQIDLVVVESDALNAPRASVDLIGLGAVPELEISPAEYDFGEVFIGCDRAVDVTLTNVGSDTLVIQDIQADGVDMSYQWDIELPTVLEPGENRELTVRFEPTEEQLFEGLLSVSSNEPLGVREATQSGRGRFVNYWTENFEIPEDPPSDIMFVVDQSCSMGDDQDRLASNFAYFIQNLNTYTEDWQIIVGNDSGGCNNAGTILRPSTPGYEQRFQEAVRTGTDPYIDDPERLLITADYGVNNTDPGQCNEGFMREDAMLHVILVSDEREQSNNWKGHTRSIVDKKGDLAMTKISAIAGPLPSGCGGNEAGTGYWEATEYTGGLFLSICETDWSAYMEDLARASAVIPDSFALANKPWEPSLEVYIDGELVDPSYWTWDESGNTVVFNEGYGPEAGDIVTVSYGEYSSCD